LLPKFEILRFSTTHLSQFEKISFWFLEDVSYLFASSVLVEDPASESVPPVLDLVCLCELTSLAVSEAALSLKMRHQVLRVQFHFQEFAHRPADDFFWTPGTAVLLLADAETVEIETIKIQKLLDWFRGLK
jgi:hypothetical protein